MSPMDPVPVSARLTVRELADAIDIEIAQVQAVLEARGEPSAPADLVGPEVLAGVAKALGKQVLIESRDLALETLYELESRPDADLPTLPDRAAALVRGVLDEKEALDHEIEAASEHWSVARMPMIDRSILRLGLHELRHHPETPTAVVVSEGVRLAKTYSTERSGAFVNGVLAALARSIRG